MCFHPPQLFMDKTQRKGPNLRLDTNSTMLKTQDPFKNGYVSTLEIQNTKKKHYFRMIML